MKIAVAQLGARMHYAVPRIFSRAACLGTFFTDICAEKGLGRVIAKMPPRLLPAAAARLGGRKIPEIPRDRIVAFDRLGLAYWQRLRRARSPREQAVVHLWAGDELGRLIVRHGLGTADTVYTFNSAGLGLLRHAREQGLRSVHEQTIVPVAVQIRLLGEEQKIWKDWEPPTDLENFFGAFLENERQEWALAQRIVCGSPFVLDGIREAGGPVERTTVVAYGVDFAGKDPEGGPGKTGFSGRPLRVLTVGTVCLRKGAPYVAAIARQWRGRAEFRMAGPIELTEHGRRELADSVELLGRVPRSQIAEQFAWADVFLLPSICEGSATATYEALTAGLPVITTPHAGSAVRHGEDGFILPIRDVPAISAALQQLADDPKLYLRMSVAARNRRETLSVAAYAKRLLEAATL
jgi:glycosyltransferase involved in cell wall biosynthesis